LKILFKNQKVFHLKRKLYIWNQLLFQKPRTCQHWEKPPPILPGIPIDMGGGSGFFCGEFSRLCDKKKGLANLTKEILGIKKKKPYFEGKKLEVAIFRQFGTLSRQN